MEAIEQLERTAVSACCLTTRDEPMSRHTTFRIGGPADLFVVAHTYEALCAILQEAGRLALPVMTIGKGSNLLVGDGGIRGCVVSLAGDFENIHLRNGNEVVAGAGTSLAGLCNFAKKWQLSGLEFAWGIPGSVGGAAFMNAGAYGGEMKDVVRTVVYAGADGVKRSVEGEKLRFAYRHSVFMDEGGVLCSVTFQLRPGNTDQIAALMEDYYSRRKAKQPLNKPSAGSVFKRPEGHFAGTLIEQCGLKGCAIGGAMVSEKHAGFIVNRGGATCEDVLRLIEHIQQVVAQQTGIHLECEVKAVGERRK